MKIAEAAFVAAVVLTPLVPDKAAACDQLIGTILTKHLAPVVQEAGCPVAEHAGLNKKGHKLAGVCYESSGPTSRIRIDTHLNCHASGESVVSKLVGDPPSISENVAVEAEARGADCQLLSAKVKPSGELGKILAAMFDANGKARQALEKGLAEVCKK